MNSKILGIVPKRIMAFIVDFFILNFVVVQPLSLKIQGIVPLITSMGDLSIYLQQNPNVSKELNIFAILLAGLFFAYFVLLDYFVGQTLGKKLFKLRVVATGSYLGQIRLGNKITFLQALLRNAAVLPLFPFFLLWIVDPLTLLFKGERFSEKYAKTTVVDASGINLPKQKL